MAKMRVMVVKYGYAVVDAETETEALELTHDMEDSDFDWSDFDGAQIVDDDADFEQPLKLRFPCKYVFQWKGI